MKEEMRSLTEVALNNPKVSILAVTMTQIEMWWINWANPLVDAAATIAGFILVLVLINYHAKKIKLINKQIRSLDDDFDDNKLDKQG